MKTLLSVHSLTKSFGGLVAVHGVSFNVKAGMIMGLIGPNGAGKTTVFNLITGNYKPDSGEIVFDNKNIKALPPNRIVSMGIARTFQSIRLFPGMTVLENALAGRHCRMKSGLWSSLFRLPGQRNEEKRAIKRALEELAFVGISHQHANLAKNLSYGNQRLLEIARALCTDPRLLILDEPAGGMNDYETEKLIDLIRAIRNRGISVLLIEHHMGLVMEVCDQLTVLEYGELIAQGAPAEIKSNPQVIEAYLGVDDDE